MKWSFPEPGGIRVILFNNYGKAGGHLLETFSTTREILAMRTVLYLTLSCFLSTDVRIAIENLLGRNATNKGRMPFQKM
jgi:hypothetical protein